MISKTYKILLFLILIVIPLLIDFSGCANPLPPSGGPRDTIPPKVKEYFPQIGLINYKKNYVKIGFDKYMNKNSVQQNTIIIPSIDVDFNWSGKELKINFLEEPKENTTYSITLGTEIQDWKGNKPLESFTLIFSTGDVIDSGRISGKLISSNPNGSSVFLYKLPLDLSDIAAFDITKEKPNYNIQIGLSGLFEIKALKDGLYRLIAVRDVFKNGVYDDGEDEFGAYSEDIYIRQDSVANVKIKLGPVIDKLGPSLYDIVPISNRLIEAIFSEPLDSNYLDTDAIVIKTLSEKETEKKIKPSSIIFSPDSRLKLQIFLSDILDTSKSCKLECVLDKEKALRDTVGNLIRDTAYFGLLQPVSKELPFLPYLISASIKDSSINISPTTDFEFVFNLPLKKQINHNTFKLKNIIDSSAEKISISFKTDNIILVKPLRKLLSDVWYELSIRTDSIFSFENIKMSDTAFSYKFKTADIRNYSGISGSLKTNDKCNGNFYVIIKNLIDKSLYRTKTNDKLEWTFDELPPGEYEFEVYCDEDGNNKYSFGNAKDFRFSEKFYLPKDKVVLKPRWKVENYQLEIKE